MPDVPLLKLLPPELIGHFTPAERVVLEQAGRRAPAEFVADEEAGDRVLRADFLYWLCTDPEASKHVHAKGVWIEGARVDGVLDFEGATLGSNEVSVNARNLSIADTLFWRSMETAPTGEVRLLHARVGQLTDDQQSWPDAGKVVLEGFVYEGFGPNSPQTAIDRLRWLGLQSTDPFMPQPYEQLARVFWTMGREVDARLVLIAKQEARRKHADLNRRTKAWLWFLRKSIRYGYEPWRVAGFMTIMILIGSIVFSRDHMISTTDFTPAFSAFVYSLEVFVPLVELHQERYYLPCAARAGGTWILGFFWMHIILGWVSSTLLVAALTGLIQRD